MQRKKYKITGDEYRIFKNYHLMNLIRNSDETERFGESFLNYFPKILEEYIIIGGDYGQAEAEKLWLETDVEQAEKIIKFWIE